MRPEELLKRCRAETISCHHADAECDSAVQLKLHYKYSTPFIRQHRDQPVNMLISALEPPVDIRGTARIDGSPAYLQEPFGDISLQPSVYFIVFFNSFCDSLTP